MGYSPTHETCLLCSAMSGLMKLACLQITGKGVTGAVRLAGPSSLAGAAQCPWRCRRSTTHSVGAEGASESCATPHPRSAVAARRSQSGGRPKLVTAAPQDMHAVQLRGRQACRLKRAQPSLWALRWQQDWTVCQRLRGAHASAATSRCWTHQMPGPTRARDAQGGRAGCRPGSARTNGFDSAVATKALRDRS